MGVDLGLALARERNGVPGVVGSEQAGHAHHETVHGLGNGNGVQCDDARRRDLIQVSGGATYVGRLQVEGEFGRVDQSVACLLYTSRCV